MADLNIITIMIECMQVLEIGQAPPRISASLPRKAVNIG